MDSPYEDQGYALDAAFDQLSSQSGKMTEVSIALLCHQTNSCATSRKISATSTIMSPELAQLI